MVKVFFSYSHKDEELRDVLETHLISLKRQGIIENWHDRRLYAGAELDDAIKQELDDSEIILLLVSPDFIASDYCYTNELKKAMDKHKARESVVIPVILRPCHWQELPFGKLLATPSDGKPVTKFPSLDDAFFEVTNEIKKVANKLNSEPNKLQDKINLSSNNAHNNVKDTKPRSSNLRIKKQFSDHERNQFLVNGFEYITNFFEASLEELQTRNSEIAYDFRKIDSNNFSVILFFNGNEINSCKISLSMDDFHKGICCNENLNRGSYSLNNLLSVGENGYYMYLTLSYDFMQENKKLTYEGAAEKYWTDFVAPLQ